LFEVRTLDFLGSTDQSEENIYVRLGGVQIKIRTQHLQSVSQKRYRVIAFDESFVV